ncbi:MAG: ABC transporter permease subunit [Thermoanaerobaculia bacterium]|nr:ABC transporter permease subunit [Thermoanaerobaculia bacterium]
MRRAADRLFRVATGACAVAACAVLVGIVGTILWKGLPALDWDLLTAAAGETFGTGGLAYQILGTLLLVATAFAVATPLAVGLALAQASYFVRRSARERVRLLVQTLNGVPSVVLGILGFVVLVRYFAWGKSWLAGGLVLGVMIAPTMTVALAERVEALPRRYLDAARGLGLTRGQTVRSVVLPQTRSGLVSGALLGLARAAGETAPLLFTAAVFSGATIPGGIRESPVLALPYHVFVLAQDTADAAARAHLWAAAFVLLAIVLGLALAALPLRLRSSEEARHG